MTMRAGLAAPDPPFDSEFYTELYARRSSFEKTAEIDIPGNTGHGFTLNAGQAWRLVAVDRPAGVDVAFMSAADPNERFAPAAQLAIEGVQITRFTRLWGTPPSSRPLCTVLADTFSRHDQGHQPFHYVGLGGHCNPHEWMEHAEVHPRTCEDNFRAAAAMLGLGQRAIGENINGGCQLWMDPRSGFIDWSLSPADPGDHIEFFAEIPIHVLLSLCPSGDGTLNDGDFFASEVNLPSMLVEIYETGVEPLEWPYRD